MKWKAKNDTCGVPGKGFIKAEDFSQEDEDNITARAKSRGIDENIFFINAGFVRNNNDGQLELVEEPKPKKKRGE
jgi:hypothetical protein